MVTLVGVCDAILYSTILKAVLPTAIQMFPENVLKIIRKFADDIVCSLQYSLKQQHVPDNLVYVKMKREDEAEMMMLSLRLKRGNNVLSSGEAAVEAAEEAHIRQPPVSGRLPHRQPQRSGHLRPDAAGEGQKPMINIPS